MSSIFTLSILQSALELGCIYALVALALFVSFSLLGIADLSTDGCFTLGCAVGAVTALAGHPILALFMAMLAGTISGFVTAFLQTRLGIESILAGIIVNTGLYTINIAIMGFSSNVNLFASENIFSMVKGMSENETFQSFHKLILAAGITLFVCIVLGWFLNTRLGLSIRATGDNPYMIKSSSINPIFTITVGLCVSNSMTALSGAVLAQYQKSCDINIGTGQVTIALASLVIGGTIISRGSMIVRILGVVLGSCLYRFIVAIALRMSVPAEALKLVSAIIVAVAIALPYLRKQAAFQKLRLENIRQNKMEIESEGDR